MRTSPVVSVTEDTAAAFAPVRVSGKFLDAGHARFLIKGVAYGTFAPDAAGSQFPPLDRAARDFAMMREAGFNTVRTYTVPDAALLDLAADHGLRMMVGLPWLQHVAFLDDRRTRESVRRDVLAHVRALAAHPSVLLVALGNEIPASVVRWLGSRRVEAFLHDLYRDAKALAPDTLFTYVNYPPTEHLNVSFSDIIAFNVYLHREQDLRAYVARLQNIAGYKPLLLAEAGADSIREQEGGQAELTAMQLRTAFAEGACGAVAFTWTDDWWRGGQQVDDWAFGLVDRDRRPKPALAAVTRVFEEGPFRAEARREWPKVSVVVCAYNAAATIDECLASLATVTYPGFEVIVVNDGSRDDTGTRARRHPGVTVIDVPNGGLSAARNIGLQVASGDIVAYTDADVRVDRDWLTYLVQPLLTSDVVGTGGPNVVPPDNHWMAQCVARAPGGPTHVLVDDRIAEHVPGCNMAFRREALLAIGGFNPIYLRAGDDVDVCWRLQARGWKIGFAPAALVWHHHRASLRAYWRQQVGYGEGETWLVPHHPDKFAGRKIAWRGHIYSPLPFVRALSQPRVNTGVWGTAAFPSVYYTHAYPFAFVPHTVRWQIGCIALFAASLIAAAILGSPIALLAGALGVAGLATTIVRCVRYAMASDIESLPAIGGWSRRVSRAAYRTVIAWLHFVQPFARGWGRVQGMLSPPRIVASPQRRIRPSPHPSRQDVYQALRLSASRHSETRFWSEKWIAVETLLSVLAARLRSSAATRAFEIDDGWQADRDVRVAVGPFAWIDLRALIEVHEGGRCLVRIGQRLRATPLSRAAGAAMVAWMAVVAAAASPLTWAAVNAASGSVLLGVCGLGLWRVGRTLGAIRQAVSAVATELHMLPMPPAARPSSRARRLDQLDVRPVPLKAQLDASARARREPQVAIEQAER